MKAHPPTSEAGLTAAEAAARSAAGQGNRPPRDGWRAYAEIFARNTLTPFNMLVVPAAIALFVLKDYRGAWAVSAMAFFNTLIGLAHETRAKWHLDQLSLLGETRVRVRRDNAEHVIAAGDVVRGDLLLLAAGETVVADGRVVSAEYLEIDEALLTGESDPVAKSVGELVLSGSVCVAGEGSYVAEQVGSRAFAAKTAAAARAYRYAPGPTQRTLDRLVQWLTAVAVSFCLGYGFLYFVRDLTATVLVQMMAATITSMVPQGLVLLTTLVFVLAATRLARRGALVQRLMAVEGLASVDVLCTDKTGTVTTGRQTLDHLRTFGEGEAIARAWLSIFAAGSVDRRNKSIEALREALPVEAARVEALDHLPFQSRNRCSALVARIEGTPRLLVLGSFEALAPRMAEAEKAELQAAWQDALPTGLRLLVFAAGKPGDAALGGRIPEVALRPLALVALRDELRPGVTEVLAALAEQGIRFKVVSGDHPETVRATVRGLGAVFGDTKIVTGDEWIAAGDRSAAAESCDLFGRVSPEQKLALVSALQAAGRNVGMIGDGVNDVLPVKRADFGVAMGAGSPATRTVAGLVLESDDFAALPAVLAEGRRVVQNVRRAAKLFLLKNIYTAVLILAAVGLAGLPFPYLPQQVTLLNALTIGVPAVLLLTGRAAAPRPVGGFFADVGPFLIVAGAATSLVGLAIFLGAMRVLGLDLATARTLLLSTLIFAGVGNAAVAARGDRRLLAWAVLAALAYFLAARIPAVAYFFALAPLDGSQWALALLASAFTIGPTEFFSSIWSRASESRSRAEDDPRPGAPGAFGPPPPRG